MKKTITAIALGSIVGFGSVLNAAMDELSATSTVAFESNYVFRGGQQYSDNGAIQPSLDLSMPVYEGSAYVGFWGSYAESLASDSSEGFSETDLYIGYEQDLTDYASIDGGFTYYGLEDATTDTGGPVTDRWKEIYAGVSFDGLMPAGMELSPSVYAYWNFSGDALTIDSSIGHSIALDQVVSGLSFDLGANLGIVDFGDANGDQVPGEQDDAYTYWGGTADLVYTVNDVASFSLGARYAGNNNDTRDGGINGINPGEDPGANLYTFDSTDSILWWGMSATFGF